MKRSIFQSLMAFALGVFALSFANAQPAPESLANNEAAATVGEASTMVSSLLTAENKAEIIKNIKIGNFGQLDERYYRGAQPLESDYQSLKDLGVNTVIDLRNDPTDYEKPA